MLKKQFRIVKDTDFKKIYRFGKTFSNSFFVVKVFYNKMENSRFGFVISKKVASKTVLRNKVKRRLREIIRTNFSKIKPGFDVIIVNKLPVVGRSYKDIEKQLLELFKKARIYNNH